MDKFEKQKQEVLCVLVTSNLDVGTIPYEELEELAEMIVYAVERVED